MFRQQIIYCLDQFYNKSLITRKRQHPARPKRAAGPINPSAIHLLQGSMRQQVRHLERVPLPSLPKADGCASLSASHILHGPTHQQVADYPKEAAPSLLKQAAGPIGPLSIHLLQRLMQQQVADNPKDSAPSPPKAAGHVGPSANHLLPGPTH